MPGRSSAPRTEILHVRLSEAERTRLRAAASAEYLDESAWARRAILLALDASRQNAGPTGDAVRDPAGDAPSPPRAPRTPPKPQR